MQQIALLVLAHSWSSSRDKLIVSSFFRLVSNLSSESDILKCVRKMQREHIKSMTVKAEAAEDWSEYVESYFPQTVYSEKCRTWYKAGREEGRVVGLWPGSCLHAVFAMENVRFEDFDYQPLKKQRNRFGWLGNG